MKKRLPIKIKHCRCEPEKQGSIWEKAVCTRKRNNELKIKLAEYEEDETDQWKAFKLEFKHDMDELGKAFSDFTVK